ATCPSWIVAQSSARSPQSRPWIAALPAVVLVVIDASFVAIDVGDTRSGRSVGHRPSCLSCCGRWPILRQQSTLACLGNGGGACRRSELPKHRGDVVGDRPLRE